MESTKDSSAGMKGKVCIVTGANTGIGKETSLALASLGMHVVMACRSKEKAETAMNEIRASIEDTLSQRGEDEEHATFGVPQVKSIDEVSLEVMSLDLSDLTSVRKFVEEFLAKHEHLHYLVLNAGVATADKQVSAQGHELMFATNHLGHFFLTQLLLDTLAASEPARVVVVSSDAHKYCGPLNDDLTLVSNPELSGVMAPMMHYGVTKLCNVLFTVQLAKVLKEKGVNVTVNAVHPGTVKTEVLRHSPWYMAWIIKPISLLFFRTPEQGARTSVYCTVAQELDGVSGKYFSSEKEDTPKPFALDEKVAAALWTYSEELVRDY